MDPLSHYCYSFHFISFEGERVVCVCMWRIEIEVDGFRFSSFFFRERKFSLNRTTPIFFPQNADKIK